MLCRVSFIVLLSVNMLSVIMLSVIMLSVIMLSVIMLSVIMLSVIVLSVIMLNVVMLSVVAPLNGRSRKWVFYHHLGTTLKYFYKRNLQVFEIS